jgi:hypothetical protein
MSETITDPAGMGFVHPGPFPDEYATGEIGDICEPGGSMDNSVGLGSLPTYMPFLFLHVSRYWSNADNQCMPQFDKAIPGPVTGPFANNGFVYNYAPATPQGINVYETGATPVPNGFWGNALSSSPTDEPNVRVTDLTTSSPQQFGNSIDLGGSDQTLSYSPSSVSGLPTTQIVANVNADDQLVLELWDGATGQGCSAMETSIDACHWPPPQDCALIVQPPQYPTTAQPCTATVLVETNAYKLPEPPVTGDVIYTLTAPGSSVFQQSTDPHAPPSTCDAITPCGLTLTIPGGSNTYALTATDTVSVVPRGHLPGSPPPPNYVSLSCSLRVKFNFPTTGPALCPGGTFTLTVIVSGPGTVKSTDGNISCTNSGGTCSFIYANGATVGLTAVPAGTNFSHWTNSNSRSTQCDGTAPSCAVVMTQNLTVTAVFLLGTP